MFTDLRIENQFCNDVLLTVSSDSAGDWVSRIYKCFGVHEYRLAEFYNASSRDCIYNFGDKQKYGALWTVTDWIGNFSS